MRHLLAVVTIGLASLSSMAHVAAAAEPSSRAHSIAASLELQLAQRDNSNAARGTASLIVLGSRLGLCSERR